MATTRSHGLSSEAERALRTIFKRCVQCPTETPTCPDCPNGQICSLVPQDCYSCQHMVCIANPSPAPPPHKTNVGAIAGGIIGGVAFMAFFIFIFWRFWIKKRREQQELEADWEEDDIAQQKHGQFNTVRSDAASTRTRGSIANSILSRASNIIQIAYIPGVTNRSGSANNSLLNTVPVPPIPAAYANNNNNNNNNLTPKSPLSNQGDALFFRPGSLRGSTYSDGSSIRSNNRDTKYSITPSLARSSVMSDIYRDDATTAPMPVMPATQALRAAPRMVSVKSSAASSPLIESPASGNSPNPAKVLVPGQNVSLSPSSSTRSGSGPSFVKATQVTVGGKGKGRFPIARQPSDASMATSGKHTPVVSSPLVETAESDYEEEHARARRSLIAATARAADPSPLVQPMESPFFDASDLQSTATLDDKPNPYVAMSASVRNEKPQRGERSLSAIVEEAKRTSQGADSGASGTKDAGPFSDVHATQ